MLRGAAVPRLRAHPRLGLLTSCCVALGALTAVDAHAEAGPVTIAWQTEGEPACSKPAEAESEVVRLAGAPAASAHFDVRCQALSEGRQRCAVRVAESSAQSERVLASCAEARETALLIMAMALTPAPPSPTPTTPEPTPAPADDTQQPHASRWLLSLAALADYGTLPGANFGPSLGVSFAWRLWHFGLAARYLPPRGVSELPPDVEAEVSWFAGALGAAWVWRAGAWGLGPRLELELGLQHGRARGVEQADPANAIWAAGSAGGVLELWLHARIGLELAALVGAPVRRPRFGFADDAPFYTATPYFVRGTLGVTFRLDAKD